MSEKDVQMNFSNHYTHCGVVWSSMWDSMCNDRCPKCGVEVEPFKSDDLRGSKGRIHRKFSGTSEIYEASVTVEEVTKAKEVGLAIGELDVFIQIDLFEDDMSLELDDSPESKEILDIIEDAKKAGCKYVHFY